VCGQYLSDRLVRIPTEYLVHVLSVRMQQLKNFWGIFTKFCFEKFYENIEAFTFYWRLTTSITSRKGSRGL